MTSTTRANAPAFPAGTRLIAIALAPLADPAAACLGANGVNGRKPVERTSTVPQQLHELAPCTDPQVALHLLLVPCEDEEQPEWAHVLRDALKERFAAPDAPCTVLQLPGAVLAHCARALAVCAPVERLAQTACAALEGACVALELQEIEAAIEAGWTPMEQVAPLAFEFNDRSLDRRSELAARFVALIGLCSRLARLSPRVLAPQVYPPTLASQVGERLRERLRLQERLEATGARLEAQERVFELCSHRMTEFSLARRGHTLEWIIIVLLAGQTLLWILDALGSVSKK